mmetsp:Transcript_34018/g.78590  ORF Transcript_34018/g.78590 Transcript_34018/m.78590 type:complete len:314 (+) Transcript_34018:101-1042(+)
MASYALEGSYGKQAVPVFKIRKHVGGKHDVVDLMVEIMLEGEVQESWLSGENHQILPTETQKNTCYVNALNTEYDSSEQYGLALARDILDRHSHIQVVNLAIEERPWTRVTTSSGAEHNHVFMKPKDPHKITSKMRVPRSGHAHIVSGVDDLCLMKTTQSGFSGFIVDEYTTLQPVGGPGSANPDRIMCTELSANWEYCSGVMPSDGFKVTNAAILQTLLDVWGGDPQQGIYSKSVQQTAYRIATAILDNFPCIDAVTLTTPNIHHYRHELEQFGLENPNIVFQSTDCHTTASGRIITRLSRDQQRARPQSRL